MFNFIKWNWKSLALILAIVAAVIVANEYTLHLTRGAYNLFEIAFLIN
jgi:hypothetical protein